MNKLKIQILKGNLHGKYAIDINNIIIAGISDAMMSIVWQDGIMINNLKRALKGSGYELIEITRGVNLKDEIDYKINWAVKTFVHAGWIQEDTNFVRPHHTHYLSKYVNGITFNPQILYYGEKNEKSQAEDVAKIWVKCKVTAEKTKYKTTMKKLKEYLINEMKLGLFKDPDAQMGIYTYPKQVFQLDELMKFSFYINPHYPEGHCDYHVL